MPVAAATRCSLALASLVCVGLAHPALAGLPPPELAAGNQVPGGNFDFGLGGFALTPGAEAELEHTFAYDVTLRDSGAALVTHTADEAGAIVSIDSLCFALSDQEDWFTLASAQILPQAALGSVAFELRAHDQDGCSGPASNIAIGDPVTTAAVWEHRSDVLRAIPSGTRSARVRASVTKLDSGGEFGVVLDGFLVLATADSELQNPAFDPGAPFGWPSLLADAQDAHGDPVSGSGRVTGTLAANSFRQYDADCIDGPFEPGSYADFTFSAHFTSTIEDPLASIRFVFESVDGPGCSGSRTFLGVTSPTVRMDEFETVRRGAELLESTESLRIFTSIGVDGGGNFDLRLDDTVVVVPEPGAGLTLATLCALAACGLRRSRDRPHPYRYP